MKTLSMDTFDQMRKLKIGAHRILVIRIFVVMLVSRSILLGLSESLTAHNIVESNTRHPSICHRSPRPSNGIHDTSGDRNREGKQTGKKGKPRSSHLQSRHHRQSCQHGSHLTFSRSRATLSSLDSTILDEWELGHSNRRPTPASTVSVPIQTPPWSLRRPARKSVSFPIKAAIFKELPFQPFLITLLSIRKPTMVNTRSNAEAVGRMVASIL